MGKNNNPSADDLIKMLTDIYASDEETEEAPAVKEEPKQKFRFIRKKTEDTVKTEAPAAKEEEKAPVTEEKSFETPVAKSKYEDLDPDELLKMFVPDVYDRLRSDTDKMSETLGDIDTSGVRDESDGIGENYESPDRDLYAELNKDGKVCDIPDIDFEDGGRSGREEDEPGSTKLVAVAEETKKVEEPVLDEDGDETISLDDLSRLLSGEKDTADDGMFDEPVVPIEIKEKNTVSEAAAETPEKEYNPAAEAIAKTVLVPVLAENTEEGGEDQANTGKPSDTDTNIMLAFGLDDELDVAFGKEDAEKLRNANEAAADTITQINVAKTEKKSNDVKDIVEEYRKMSVKNTIAMLGTAVVAIVLLFFENLSLLGGRLSDTFNPEFYPVVNAMAGLQILFIGFVFTLPYFVKGCRAFAEKKPTVECIIPVMLAVTVLYAILSSLFPAGTSYKLHFFATAVSLVLVTVSRRLDIRREKLTLGIISSKRLKFALEKLDLEGSELETQAFNGFLPEAPSIFKINKAQQIDGFRERTEEYPSSKLNVYLLCGGIGLSAVIGFAVGFIVTKTWSGAVSAAYLATAFCTPASMFMMFSLPSFRAEKVASADGSAFVGEAAVDEYTTASSISFDDREVFPTSGVKLLSLKMLGENARIDNAVYYLASVYTNIGGPLSDVLNVATADIGRSERTEILSVEASGVEALVDGIHIFLGKEIYLNRKGFGTDGDASDASFNGTDVAVMYMICDNELYAKVYVRYAIDPEFTGVVKAMYKAGVCVGIKTIDPNIDDEMLSSRINLEKYPVRVLKYASIDDRSGESGKIDSGIVSKRSVKALLRTFSLCEKIKHVTRTNLVISGIAMIIGLIIAILVTVFGSTASVYSLFTGLYGLVWLLPAFLLAKLLI